MRNPGPWFGFLYLDDELRAVVVAALALGRRELRRNGTSVPRAFDELLATVAAQNGQPRPPIDTTDEPLDRVLVGYEEAGQRMGVSTRTVRRLVAEGELPAVRASRRVLLRVEDLQEFGVRRRVG